MNLDNTKNYKQYQVIYVDRKTGKQEMSDTFIHLEEKEVIQFQITFSTVKTIVMLREI